MFVCFVCIYISLYGWWNGRFYFISGVVYLNKIGIEVFLFRGYGEYGVRGKWFDYLLEKFEI